MKSKLFILIGLLIILGACQTQTLLPQSTTEYLQFLPIISKDQLKYRIGVGNENSLGKDLVPYYKGDFLGIYVHADVFQREGTTYLDSRDIPGSRLFLQLKGARAEWIMPTCAAIPQAYWKAWVEEFAIVVIDYLGADRIVYIDIMNEPEGGDFAPEYLGCWGNDFSAGAYYAQFTNFVATELRHRYPHIKFSAGAFTDPPNSPDFVAGFFSEIDSIDIVSVHLHQWYTSPIRLFDLVDYMHSITDLPLALSETSVVCGEVSLNCDQAQAEHFKNLTVLIEQEELEFFIWYTLGLRKNCWSWQYSDMILCDYVRPVYEVYAHYMEK